MFLDSVCTLVCLVIFGKNRQEVLHAFSKENQNKSKAKQVMANTVLLFLDCDLNLLVSCLLVTMFPLRRKVIQCISQVHTSYSMLDQEFATHLFVIFQLAQSIISGAYLFCKHFSIFPFNKTSHSSASINSIHQDVQQVWCNQIWDKSTCSVLWKFLVQIYTSQ